MMVNIENKNGLKGQYNSAQGFGVSSVERLRPGVKVRQKNRPHTKVFQGYIIVSDEKV